MPKYNKGAEENEIERVSRWMRGIFLRPPPPVALEVKLNRGDDGEAQLLRLEREDLTTSPEAIAEHIFDECKGESDRLTGTNRFVIYLYREGFKEGRRPSGHCLFRIESPEDESVMSEIQRSEPLNEKGFTQAMMRFSLDERREMRAERTATQRHMEMMFSMMSQQVQKMSEQQLTIIDVTNQALDRKEERAIAVRREMKKDEYAELAAKQVFPLLGPLVGKVLQKFAPELVPPKEASPQVAPETVIVYQLISLLNTFTDEQATAFKAMLTASQSEMFLGKLIPLINRRGQDSGTALDMEIACQAYDFIGSFTEDQPIKLSSIVTPPQLAAFSEFFELIKKFKETREKQESQTQQKAAE